MSRRRAAEEREEEAREADGSRLLPLTLEYRRIELGAGQECQHDGAGAREDFDPSLVGAENSGADGRADDELRDGADDDLRQCGRHSEPDGQQRRDEREAEP